MGLKRRDPLPRMVMEGFQEQVAFTRLWDRKKGGRHSNKRERLEQRRRGMKSMWAWKWRVAQHD